jgi:hypothetical protein
MAENFDRGMICFGIWCLVLVLSFTRYFIYFQSLQFIIELLYITAKDIFALVIIFVVMLVGFMLVGMGAFSMVSPEYASGFATLSSMLDYFAGGGDISLLAENAPAIGIIFYFAVKFFINFFMLNILIAVITAPLGDLQEESTLNLELMMKAEKRQHQVEGFDELGAVWAKVQYTMIAWVGILFDSLPYPLSPTARKWKEMHFDFTCLSNPWKYRLEEVLLSVSRILSLADSLSEETAADWRTALYSMWEIAVDTRDEFLKPMLRVGILTCAPLPLLRDALLNQAMISYDRFSTRLQRLIEQQEEEKVKYATKGEEIKQQIDEYQEEFNLRFGEQTEGNETLDSTTVNKMRRKSDGDGKVQNVLQEAKVRSSFCFTRFIEVRLREAFKDAALIVAVTILFWWYTATILQVTVPTAFMCTNIHDGLRDAPYRTSCGDADCSTAFSVIKTYKDIGHILDVAEYAQLSLGPQIFPTTLPYTIPAELVGVTDTFPVFWDNYLRRTTNVTIRQVRSKKTPCHLPDRAAVSSLPFADAQRLDFMYNSSCFATRSLDQSQMERPSNSPLPASAYQFQTTCAEVDTSPTLGNFGLTYPCAGFMASVNSNEELQYALTNWIDEGTRLIVISISFEIVKDRLQYNQFIELGNSGGFAMVWTRIRPLGEFPFKTQNLVAVILVAIEAFLLLIVYVLSWKRAMNEPLFERELEEASVPTASLCFLLVYIIITLSLPEDDLLRATLQSILCSSVLTYKFIAVAVFPLAELVSRRAPSVRRTFELASLAIVSLLPFFVVSFIAFFIAGHVLYGRMLPDYGSLPMLAQAVAAAFLDGFDFESLVSLNAPVAYIFTFMFFIVVLVILSNLVLTLIVSAADEARAEDKSMSYLESSAEYVGGFVLSGPFASIVVFAGAFWFPEEHPEFSRLIVSPLGRLSLPMECLLPYFGPRRLADVTAAMRLEPLPNRLVYTAVGILLKQYLYFEQRCPNAALLDQAREYYYAIEPKERRADDALPPADVLKCTPRGGLSGEES